MSICVVNSIMPIDVLKACRDDFFRSIQDGDRLPAALLGPTVFSRVVVGFCAYIHNDSERRFEYGIEIKSTFYSILCEWCYRAHGTTFGYDKQGRDMLKEHIEHTRLGYIFTDDSDLIRYDAIDAVYSDCHFQVEKEGLIRD